MCTLFRVCTLIVVSLFVTAYCSCKALAYCVVFVGTAGLLQDEPEGGIKVTHAGLISITVCRTRYTYCIVYRSCVPTSPQSFFLSLSCHTLSYTLYSVTSVSLAVRTLSGYAHTQQHNEAPDESRHPTTLKRRQLRCAPAPMRTCGTRQRYGLSRRSPPEQDCSAPQTAPSAQPPP